MLKLVMNRQISSGKSAQPRFHLHPLLAQPTPVGNLRAGADATATMHLAPAAQLAWLHLQPRPCRSA